MAKQLNVNLSFNADISQAQKSIQSLQQSLSKISSMKTGDNLQLKEASEAAKMLSYHLNQAYNASTGNIDLSALNNSLQKSSTNVTQLSNKLLQAGNNGQQAFVNLAQAISSAEYPMFKLGKRLTEFGNTLKNTVRWQFSSSLLHGMMGAYQQAIGYAEDLNTSLTNIRVVTGNNTEEMARFAEHANKAAKSLSTTTTAYTDAALIFYQQGLKDKDVKERTDITIKMANVTGDSVTTVSDQLTAIWNNFNKEGDVAYEHYADVLTALGAATASSTDEIAGGLEKFAAIADTIGLSYEYAAAALATITSNTRQSEEVVGTALKTIFARLQGLKLGETLEDGTDLNKYSEALQKVGVDVLDATGELRRADDILTDMAARWESLSNAEQVALAQAVGGVRQYNQIVALMDEWDSGDADSMLANLETAYNSDGALQKQADIWAESWEAAQKRVRAAAEGVYDSILDDKLFIDFNNVFADMLTGLEQVIDGIGGLKGVFVGVGSFILSLMAHKIQPALNNFVLNIKSIFSSAQAQAAALTNELQSKVSTELSKDSYDTSQKQALSNANSLAEARTRLTVVSKDLTEQEKLLYQFDINLMEQDAQKAQSVADEITALERERDALYQSVDATQEKIAINQIYDQELKSLIDTQSMWKAIMDESYDGGTEREQVESADEYIAARQAVDEYIASKQTLNSIIEQTTQAIMDEYTGQEYAIDGFEQGAGILQAFTNNLNALSNELGDTNRQFSANEVDKYKRQLDLFGKTLDNLQGISADTKKELAQLFAQAKASKDSKTMQSNIARIISKIKDLKFTSQQLKDMGISLSPSQFKKFLSNLEEGKRKEKELITIQDELNNKMNNFNPSHMIGGLERLASAASVMGSVAMMGQSISSMINSWNNTDLSFGEKLSTTFMSLSMLIPGAISSIKSLNTVLQGTALQQSLVSAAMKLTTKDTEIAAAKTILLTKAKGASLTKEQQEIVTKGVLVAALAAEGIALDKNTLATAKNKVAVMIANGAKKEEIVAYLATIPGITAETAAKIANKLATDALKTSVMGLLGPIGLIIAAITALVAAFNAWNKAQKEAAKWDAEQNQEQVDKIMERVDALKAEREELDSLMEIYKNAKANSDGTVEAQQAIANATWDICEALGIEIDLLDKLQNKTSGYDNKIYAKNAKDALKEIQDFQKSWDDIDKNFYTKYQDAVYTIKPTDRVFGDEHQTYGIDSISRHAIDKNGVAYSPDYGYSVGGFTDKQDEAFRKALKEYLSSSEFKYADKMDIGLENEGVMQFKGGVNAAEQYEIISDIISHISNQLDANQQKNSEMFKWYEAIVDAGKETWNNKNSAEAEVEAQIQKYAENQTQIDEKMSYDQISTYDQYLKIRDKFIENLQEGYSEAGLDIDYTGFDSATEYLQSIAEESLFAYDNISKLQGIELLAEQNLNLPKEQLHELYEQYKDVFKFDGSINFDEITSIQQLRDILEKLQAEADANALQAKVETVKSAKSNLKEDMSYGDYMDFESSSGIKWGQYDEDLKNSVIDYTSFLQMSYEEQVSYLDFIQKSYQETQAKALSDNFSSSKDLFNSYLEEYQGFQEKIQRIKEENAAPTLEKLNEFKDLQSQQEVGSEGYNAYAEGINKLTAQYEQIMNSDGLSLLSEEELSRMYELETLMGTTQNNLNSLDAQLDMIVSDILSSATSVSELESSVTSLLQNGIMVDYNTYADALINLASEYDNCANEIKEFQAVLNSGNDVLIESKQQQLEAAIAIGEAADQYDIAVDTLEGVADGFEALAKSGKKQYEILEKDGEALADASVRYTRLNEAVLDLAENYEDYFNVLKDISKATDDVEKAMIANSKSGIALQKSLAGILGTTEDMIDANLLAAIDPKDFEKAAKGDEEAIGRIRDAFIELQAEINNIDASKLKEELAGLEEGIVVDINADTMPLLYKLIEAKVIAGAEAAEIEALLSGFNIDADVTDFVGSMNEMIEASAQAGSEVIANTSFSQTVDQVTAETPVTKESVGFTENYSTTPITRTSMVLKDGMETPVPVTETYYSWNKSVDSSVESETGVNEEVGTSVTTSNAAGETGQVKGVQIKNAHKSTGGKVGGSTKRSASKAMNKKSGGGGGSSSKPQAPDKADKKDITKKSEIVERYREVEDAIDNVTDALTKAERASDRLWGKDKLNSMREENKILKQQYNLLQEKAEQAKKYAEEDYAALMEAAGKAGINLSINKETGDITNIEDAMESLYGRLSSAEQEYNRRVEEYNKRVNAAGANPSQAEVDTLEAMKKSLEVYEKDVIGGIEDDIDAVKDAESSFKDSVEIWEESGLEMEEILDQIMQNNYEVIMQGLEIPLSLNEEDLRLVDLKLSQIEDNIYQMAEALVLSSGKIEEYKDNLRLTDEALAELNRAHEAGEITDAAYQEGLQEIKDSYYDNVEALIELDNLMKDYYGNTLDAANEELSKYTEQIEHQTSVLEYYNSLIDLMGKSNDYKMIGKVLEGQVKTTKNAAEISKNWYESRKADAEALEQQYQNALASGASAEELELLKNNWQAAEKAANEAQKQMLSDAEAWAEALKAVLENKLSELGQVLENALTGEWGSFDAMTTSMERANSLQEEYLTTTNQIYETNKLMRTAQQAIDKTTNSVAKKKLAAYVEETKQMQDQSKLSTYELEIQQAKYNLLLAQIAIEEAQDAKSTVRLQRDSEGNFGYVYTADSNKINEAQQQLEDAQNKLYNIGLEGANSYAEKYQQTMAEMYDTLNQIQQDYLTGSFESEEEYQTAMQTAKDYYYQKLKDYSSLYSVALTTDSRVVADAWSTDFSSMIYDTEIWMIAVNDYTDGAIGAFRDWQNAVTGSGGVTEIIGNSLEEVSNNVDNVTAESQELADITNNEVIPALDAEIESVESLTGAYAAMRDTIADTIRYYEQLISDINNSQNNEWNNGSNDEDADEDENNNGGNNPNGNNPNRNNNEDNGDGGIPGGSGEGPNSNVASYKTGTLTWIGDGSARIWTDSKGKTYSANSAEGRAIQNAFNRAYSKNGGYKGDYFLGWNTLDADVLHKKYGLATGGYTGDWSGSYGKLAFLHQKELVLNAEDTRNFLESMNVLDKIISAIDLYSANSQLGGILSSPSLGKMSTDNLEQQVYIEASFPGVQNRNEIEEAFNNLINQASQYANRK